MSKNETLVLGIETSCDDTSLALIKESKGAFPKILAHISLSQEESLEKWGGVVPEIAARNHLKALPILIDKLFKDSDVSIDDVDLIGVTALPGLLGPLLTGVNLAKDISMLYQKPILPVNHLYAHLEAIHLDQTVSYPYLGLLVSGGHTILMDVQDKKTFRVMGSTMDDAAGEAFDKGGKILGLSYPAGPIIDQLAKEGDPNTFDFPIGLKSSKEIKFSFSGIKADLRRKIETDPQLIKDDQTLKNLCASYQEKIVDALVLKTELAFKKLNSKRPIVVGGGVACNSRLREKITARFKDAHFVTPKFCTDNGAMIAGYTLINKDAGVPYPLSLKIDARGRFIDKKDFR